MDGVARFRVGFSGTDRASVFSAAREFEVSDSLLDKFIDGVDDDDDGGCMGGVSVESTEELLTVLQVLRRAHACDIGLHVGIDSEIAKASASLCCLYRGTVFGAVDPVGSDREKEIRDQVKEIKRGLDRLKDLLLAVKGGAT